MGGKSPPGRHARLDARERRLTARLGRRRSLHLLALALVAAAASAPRFGERENGGAELSDSDYYLDMTGVFAGAREHFDPVLSAPGHPGSKHYARPLLPLVAALPVRALGIDPSVALSTVSVLSSWTVAALLYLFLLAVRPEMRLAWLPPALFLTGFPQVNWGYHILSDSLGYATAFASCLGCWAFLRLQRARDAPIRPTTVAAALAGLFVLQALAFSARETAWFAVVVTIALVARDGRWRRQAPAALLLLVVLLLAKLPHAVYVARFALEPVQIPFAPAAWADPLYVLDAVIKSAVAFHFAWLLALAHPRDERDPELLVAWSLAALLYMGAGYAHNSRDGIGYPLRLTYALFPWLYDRATRALEVRLPGARGRGRVALGVVLANALVSAVGLGLDPGRRVVVMGMDPHVFMEVGRREGSAPPPSSRETERPDVLMIVPSSWEMTDQLERWFGLPQKGGDHLAGVEGDGVEAVPLLQEADPAPLQGESDLLLGFHRHGPVLREALADQLTERAEDQHSSRRESLREPFEELHAVRLRQVRQNRAHPDEVVGPRDAQLADARRRNDRQGAEFPRAEADRLPIDVRRGQRDVRMPLRQPPEHAAIAGAVVEEGADARPLDSHRRQRLPHPLERLLAHPHVMPYRSG